MDYSDKVNLTNSIFTGGGIGRKKGGAMPTVYPISPKNKTYLVETYEATPSGITEDAMGLTVLEAGSGCQYSAGQNIVALSIDVFSIAGLMFVNEDSVVGLLNLNELP